MVVTLVVPIQEGHGHVYVSTACLHGQHDRCGEKQRERGEIGPPGSGDKPTCKYCPAPCVCPDPECWHAPTPAAATTGGQP